MRNISLALTAIVLAALLAGCAESSQSAPFTPPSNSIAPQSQYRVPRNNELAGIGPDAGSGVTFLAVSDNGAAALNILNGKYILVDTITNGIDNPDGDWYDAKQNLYVANYSSTNVQEYKKGATSPTFTYSAGIAGPSSVTTDKKGHVYVADYSGNAVDEFAQGKNSISASCPGSGDTGVAVDPKGDVFVAYQGTGNLVEFKGGLKGCHATVLGPTLAIAGGLILDKNQDLVACDQFVGADIIKPPYSSVSSTISGNCDNASLNASNTLLFMAEPGNHDVKVFNYPSGSVVTTLGAGNGLSDPYGVAAFPISKT